PALSDPRGLRPDLHDARDHDDLFVRDPDDDGRVRQLPDTADDRRAGHGVPAPECDLLLDLPWVRAVPVRRTRGGSWAERRMVRLRAARIQGLQPRDQHRLLWIRPDLQR